VTDPIREEEIHEQAPPGMAADTASRQEEFYHFCADSMSDAGKRE